MWGVGETPQLVSFLIHFRLPENQDQTIMLPNQTFCLNISEVIRWMVLFSGVLFFSPKPLGRGKLEYYGKKQNSIFSNLNAIAVLQVYVFSCQNQSIKKRYCSIAIWTPGDIAVLQVHVPCAFLKWNQREILQCFVVDTRKYCSIAVFMCCWEIKPKKDIAVLRRGHQEMLQYLCDVEK